MNIPSIPRNGNTFLHIATRSGQIGITEMILIEENEVNTKNNLGKVLKDRDILKRKYHTLFE